MSLARRSLYPTTSLLSLCFGLVIAAMGCGGSDPATSCKDMCTGAGYSSSNADVQPHEINCFCSGGTGTVTSESCTKLCQSLGKSSAMTFKSSGTVVNSCQCS
jgi:hypothetical protein